MERNYRRYDSEPTAEWEPKTKAGKLVKKGEITSLEQIYEMNLPILEPQIIDALVPDLQEEVLKVGTVQRTTDSGRRMQFMVTVAIGNKNGYVGVGIGKSQEVRPAIETAIREAKKNLIHIRRGCGSWECSCNEPHSIPFKIKGNNASVFIEILPAPKGTGIVAGKTAKKILELAGIKDAWSRTEGKTCTVFNTAKATIEALSQTRGIKLKTAGEII